MRLGRSRGKSLSVGLKDESIKWVNTDISKKRDFLHLPWQSGSRYLKSQRIVARLGQLAEQCELV
jgi:hypothetical protein